MPAKVGFRLLCFQSEKQRWSQTTVEYQKQEKTLCGDVLVASAFVSYLGYFTRQYRQELLNNVWIPFLKSQKVGSGSIFCRPHDHSTELSPAFTRHSLAPSLRLFQSSVPLTDGLDPVLMLTDDAAVAAWHNQGLPNDRMSIENAAILTTSERWPLVVDPQQQGVKWLRQRLGPELRVVQLAEGR